MKLQIDVLDGFKILKIEFVPEGYKNDLGEYGPQIFDGWCVDPRCWWGERCMFK